MVSEFYVPPSANRPLGRDDCPLTLTGRFSAGYGLTGGHITSQTMEGLIANAIEVLDDDDEELLPAFGRRPRFIRERIEHFDDLDDADFVMRFRFSKQTALNLLMKIDHRLEFPTDK